jgi:hypothetical protein
MRFLIHKLNFYPLPGLLSGHREFMILEIIMPKDSIALPVLD